MFDRRFLETSLGKAAAASVAATMLFVALSTQIHAAPVHAASDIVLAKEIA